MIRTVWYFIGRQAAIPLGLWLGAATARGDWVLFAAVLTGFLVLRARTDHLYADFIKMVQS